VLGNADTPWALDATWLPNPPNNQWINGANWSSNPAVPTGTATFNASNTTNIAISSAFVGAMQFNAGASAYTFNISNLFFFDGSGAGVINNSSSIQTLAVRSSGTLAFLGTSTAGSANIVISDPSATAQFLTASNAGSANIINNGSLSFSDQSTAGNATITTNATGRTILLATSDGGQARFITNAGGRVDFSSGGPAGDKKISAGSIEGAGDYFLAGNQLTVGSNNLSTEVSGKISDGGSLIQTGASLLKIGTGTLTLSGNNAYTGVTTVNSGSLIVNGSIAASSAVSVNSGALLGGIGTVPSTTVNNGGMLAPGSSIGTLTVQGNLVLSTASTYLIEVSPTSADRTNVSGTATLAGTVNAAFASGSYVTRNYTILSATSGLSGTFDALTMTNLPAGFNANLSYTGTDVTLNLTANMGGPRNISGLSINQANVANSLNSFFNNGGALPSNFATIFGLTGGNLANALSQLSGEAAVGAQKVGFQLTDQFLNLMLDPFVDGRSGIGAADHPPLGFAPDQETLPDDIALAYSKVLKAPPKGVPVYEPRWTVWGGAYGGSNRTTGDLAVTGSHDLSARTAGLAGGFDYRLTPDTVVGLAFAGGGTDWSLAQGLGGGRSDAFQAGLYGATKTGPAYLAAAFAFANHWMSTDRFAFGDHLTADFNAQSYGGRLEGGYRLGTPYGGITPYAAIQTQSFHTPGYTENGLVQNGFALAFSSHNATDTRSELGARFDRVMVLHSNAVLALRGRVAWAHDWVSDPTLTPLFQTLPGASFIVNGVTPAKDSALASAGAEYRLANGVALLAKFDGEFASHSTTYAGRGMLRYAW
jgi:autotransporter-associated beta strand protein